jgi:hypothetical protein
VDTRSLPPDSPSGQPGPTLPAECRGGPGAFHLTICFPASDGLSVFYPESDDPPALARRLREVVRVLHAVPGAVHYAAGDHSEACPDARPEGA